MIELKSLDLIKDLKNKIEDDLENIYILSNCPSISDLKYWEMIENKNRLKELQKFLEENFPDNGKPLCKYRASESSLQGVF